MHPPLEAKLLLGDCLPHLDEMPENSFDLIYLDPPFYTQRKHTLQPRDRSQTFAFDDSWSTQEAYGDFIHSRLKQLHRVLSPTGSIFFHCDRNAAHLARVALDRVFGEGNFRAEIIWYYRRWSNAAKGLLPAHQNILYYTKSDEFIFNQEFGDYSPSTNVDQILQRRRRDSSNKSIYLRDEDGQVVPHANKRGVPMSDVWDIPYLNPKARERVGYPTQKPLLLLERVIGLTSNPGDRVLDPFCGSGTTLVAAASMARVATGIDVSEAAIDLSKKRLATPIRSRSKLLENGRESYRTADQFLLQHLVGIDFVPVHRNAGIDAVLKSSFKGSPITLRVQREGETLLDAAQSLYRASVIKGSQVMFLVAVQGVDTFAFTGRLPSGVVCIESPSLQLHQHLSKLTESELRPTDGPADKPLQWTGAAESLF